MYAVFSFISFVFQEFIVYIVLDFLSVIVSLAFDFSLLDYFLLSRYVAFLCQNIGFLSTLLLSVFCLDIFMFLCVLSIS